MLIGNLNKEHGGAQQLLYDICSNISKDEFDITVYYMFGKGTYQDSFEEHGTTVIGLGATSNYDVNVFQQLIAHLRRADYDILQTNSPISGVWGRTAGAIASIPEIVSVEHSVHTGYPRFNRIANGLTLPLSDTVVGVSDTVINSFALWEVGLLPQQTEIHTIRNGVDVAAIESGFSRTQEVMRELPISKKSPLIGTVGRFTEAKGYKYLIRAFPYIKQSHPQAQILMIGDGELMSELQKEAKATGHADDIHFTGFISDVFPYLPGFDVAVFPSLWEGLPLAPIESMVAKRPVVATDIPAFRETIGDAGVFVEPKNEKAIATTVSSLLERPSRRDELGKRAYNRVVANLSIEKTASKYANLYREIATHD